MCKLEHIDILNDISHDLKRFFPLAGIGVSGSVAKNNHKKESDIDLLFIDYSISKSFQFVFELKGIKVNVLCFHPCYIKDHKISELKKWLYSYNVTTLGYLFATEILHDPQNLISSFIADAESFLKIKKVQKAKLLYELKNNATFLFKDIQKEANDIIKYRLYVNIIDHFLSYWFIKNKYYLRVKSEYHFVLKIIKKNDLKFYNLINDCFPINTKNIKQISKILKHLE